MRAGQLTEIIDILRLSVTTNEYGEQYDTYTSVGSTRANITPLSGRRGDINDEVFYEHAYRFIVRRYVDVRDFDHIKWNDNEYRILNIDEDKPLNQKMINAELINK